MSPLRHGQPSWWPEAEWAESWPSLPPPGIARPGLPHVGPWPGGGHSRQTRPRLLGGRWSPRVLLVSRRPQGCGRLAGRADFLLQTRERCRLPWRAQEVECQPRPGTPIPTSVLLLARTPRIPYNGDISLPPPGRQLLSVFSPPRPRLSQGHCRALCRACHLGLAELCDQRGSASCPGPWRVPGQEPRPLRVSTPVWGALGRDSPGKWPLRPLVAGHFERRSFETVSPRVSTDTPPR